MDKTEFWTIASANGIVLELEQVIVFERYHKELIYWNEKVNLISRKDVDNIYERHLLHSISALKYIEIPPKSKCLDIGTGGGLPGIPIAIATGDITMIMVDSIAKKVKIADMLAKHTGLRRISAIQSRVEDLQAKKDYLNYFNFVFARAVTRIADLMQRSVPLLKQNGIYVLYKGGDISSEIEDALAKFPQFSFEVIDIDFFGLPFFKNEEKKIVVISRQINK